MHRATLPLHDAFFFGVQFRHNAIRIQPSCYRMPMVAIGRDDVVVICYRIHCAHGDGLLARVQMTEPFDLFHLVGAAGGCLEAPDQTHGPIELNELVVSQFISSCIG
jgi:hypothetical protein